MKRTTSGVVKTDAQLAKVKNLKDLPLVQVTWRDATSNHGWYTLPEILKDATLLTECQTVGYLVRNDRRHVVVAQGRTEHGKLSELWAIPRSLVSKVDTVWHREKAPKSK